MGESRRSPCQNPCVQQRLPSLLDPPHMFGHRGAMAHLPENTLPSFALALRLGADGLESDVWVTRDGVPVLDHDGVVRRRFGRTVAITELDRADLPEHIPTLVDLLTHCGTGYQLSLDLMTADTGEVVVAAVRDHSPEMLPRLWLCARDWRWLLPLRGSGARLVDSTRLSRLKEGPERRVAMLHAEGIDALNMHHTDWNGGLVTLAHRFERCAFSWGIQDPRLLEEAFRMGVDAVYSDHPERMVDARRTQCGV